MTEEPPMRLGSAEVSDSGAVAGRDFNLRARFGAGRDINIGSVVEATTAVEARHQLPPDVADFTDREREAADVRRALEDPEGRGGVALVAGKPGVGKSALAIHLAHALSAQFPDAQLYVDLRGGEPAEHLDPLTPTEVLAGFLRALGIEQVPEQPAERVAFYRAQLAHKRALVVLDNASREDQVRPLIPGSRSCAVLVTSRMQLPGLEGARPRELEVLDPGAALELLAKLIGDRDRLERERDAAEAIVRLCGYLPLAVRIAGSRLRTRPRWSLHKLVERLADERRRLDELRAGDREVRASFALSYRELKDDEARLFRRLGVFPGPDFGVALAGALVDTSSDEAEELLERLVDVRLLEEVGEERYRFHDLLRLFARERLEADETPPHAKRPERGRWAGFWRAHRRQTRCCPRDHRGRGWKVGSRRRSDLRRLPGSRPSGPTWWPPWTRLTGLRTRLPSSASQMRLQSSFHSAATGATGSKPTSLHSTPLGTRATATARPGRSTT
jgi:NB-ARC domain